MSGVPYETVQAGLAMSNGVTSQCFALDFPSRSIITKLLVEGVEGAIGDFTVALYNNPVACANKMDSESDGSAVGHLPPDLFRVTPDIAAVSSKVAYHADKSTGGAGYVFFSQDSDPVAKRLGNPRKLYLKITGDGVGAKKFAVAVAGLIFK